jgi:hypothetical protein
MIIVLTSCKQNEEEIASGFDTFYDLHSNDKNVISIGMPKFIFKMFIDIQNKEIEEVVDNIETVDLMFIQNPDEYVLNEMNAQFPIKYYKSVISVNNEEGNIKFLAKEKREKVDELIMIARQKSANNCVLMRIGGRFNMKTVENLAKNIDVGEIVKYK